VAGTGFSRRHIPAIRAFLSSTRGEARFFASAGAAVRAAAARPNGRVACPVALADDGEMRNLCAAANVPLLRVDRGFLRDGTPGNGEKTFLPMPASLLLDGEGRHDDPSRPSGLEILLEHAPLSEELLLRARALRAALADNGLTPPAPRPPLPPRTADSRCPTLVPGQPEADYRTDFRRPAWTGNADLLRAVRAARPDARIIYLSPPDETGRDGAECAALSDEVFPFPALPSIFSQIREVHTFSSLTGFEALLRNLPVHTYGGPFYAGWGLTADATDFPRRSRALSLDGLAAAALILWPVYFDWHSRMFCGPEDILRLRRPGLSPRKCSSPLARLRRLLEVCGPAGSFFGGGRQE
jgi:capsular polysaccharide export protein